jgi:hypothetical protein
MFLAPIGPNDKNALRAVSVALTFPKSELILAPWVMWRITITGV